MNEKLSNSQVSKIGNKIKIEVYGASHAEKIGVRIHGLKPGFELDFDKISLQMARRAPGNIAYSTARKEPDLPQILSGVTENKTNGDVLEAVIFNTNQHSSDYDNLKAVPRPGHADFTAYKKFNGELDMRGGGKFSARLTAPIVFAGAVCRQLLEKTGVIIASHVKSIGTIKDDLLDCVSPIQELLCKLNTMTFPVISAEKKTEMLALIDENRRALDSIGGTVECIITGVPLGLGDSLFEGFDGKLAQYIFGIPAVKGIEFGSGFSAAKMHGSENNDAFYINDNEVKTSTNNCGGILGGITNSMSIIFTTAFKPTPSIAQPQHSVNLDTMTETTLEIKGRHDPCVVPRAAAVVEAVAALCVLDAMCENNLL